MVLEFCIKEQGLTFDDFILRGRVTQLTVAFFAAYFLYFFSFFIKCHNKKSAYDFMTDFLLDISG